MKILKACFHVGLISLACFSIPIMDASTITWTNTAGGNWSGTTNWSPNQVPGAADTAVVTNDANYAVILNVNASVAGLVLGAPGGVHIQALIINGQTFTLNGQAIVNPQGQFNFTNGTLAGASVWMGTLNLAGGTLASSGSLTVATNGVLNLVGSATFIVQGPVTNNGTLNWLGGVVQLNNGSPYNGMIWNQAGAQWNIECNQNVTVSDNFGATSFFHNAGLLTKSGVSGTTTINAFLDNLGGTVQVQVGTIQFNGGSNLGGSFQATVIGTAINFTGGNYTWNGAANFQGTVQITGGTMAVTGSPGSLPGMSGVTISGLSNVVGTVSLSGATIVGNPEILACTAYLTNCTMSGGETMSGILYWAGGTVGSSGSLTVATNAVLNLVGSATFNIQGPLTNNGTVNWLGGVVQVNNGSPYNGMILESGGGAVEHRMQSERHGKRLFWRDQFFPQCRSVEQERRQRNDHI